MSRLMTMCGSSLVDKESWEINHAPAKLGRFHQPLPHRVLIDEVLNQMQDLGMTPTDEAYATNPSGAKFFGVIELATHNMPDDGEYLPRDAFSTVVGLRASHDTSFAAAAACGTNVGVCDNMCFSGEVEVKTKQTTRIMDRLPAMIADAISQIKGMAQVQEQRVEAYQAKELTNTVADAAITQLIRMGAITAIQAPKVIEQWDEPRYEQFAERRDVWRLHNAVTEVYKPTGAQGSTLAATMPRGIKLTQLCDDLVAA